MIYGKNVKRATTIIFDMERQLDKTRIPEHIAIIMDGNGRWATERGKKRSYGHQAGVDAVAEDVNVTSNY